MSEAARRRLSLQGRRVCRFCLSAAEPLSDIYSAAAPVPLPLQVMACVAIEVFPTDGMPSTICNVCRHFMDQSYKFKQICKQSDEALRQYITQGVLQDPIQWPPEMLMSLPAGMKPHNTIEKNKKPYGKTRKLSSEAVLTPIKNTKKDECSIKITKRGDEVIVAATDDETKKTKYYMYQSETNTLPLGTPSVPTGVFPCPECERSFPLEQLRDIHAKIHMRERPFHCDTCDRSYYSKYDLQKHEEIHSGVKSFACTICDKKFLRLTLLQRHEKTHTLAPRFQCNQCDKSFLSKEQLNVHIESRHSKARQFSCDLCPKKFAFKQGLERHYCHHTEEKPFKCDYCDQGFNSANRLTRHVQSHAGERPYPCKFCPKSFLLSHHYTRHLRTHHLTKSNKDVKVKSEGVFARQQDCYKCVQCEESFSKQDDLIFHSAIHATQDLTCPLCKEKFLDVDAVTTHIKSHIEGEQYICEWCELVFTSEEKLDMHIDLVHQEVIGSDEQFNKISFLEGQLQDGEVPEEENEDGNSTDEEYDTLYESSQQVEEINEFANADKNTIQSEIEVEVMPDGQVSVKIPTDNNECVEAVAESENNIADTNPTYTELTTVTPPEYVQNDEADKTSAENNKDSTVTKPEESKKEAAGLVPKKIIAAEDIAANIEKSPVKSSQKEEKKNFMQRIEEQKLKRANEALLRKKEMISETKSPTGSKSLMLLEKDIQELKRNAKSGNENVSSGRFLAATSTPKDNREKYGKFSKIEKEKPITKTMIPISKENKDDSIIKRESVQPRVKRPGRPPKIAKEQEEEEEDTDSSISDGNYSDGDTSLIRRSSRPNKVKDYAALIRDGERQLGSDSEQDHDNDEDVDEDELEEKEYRPPPVIERKLEVVPSTGKRKRGRPRKNPETPVKKPKVDTFDIKDSSFVKRPVGRPSNKFLKERAEELGFTIEELKRQNRLASLKKKDETFYKEKVKKLSEFIEYDDSSNVKRPSTTNDTPKKVPGGVLVKTLPPGLKPVPLPPGAGVPPGVCQMKIGEKVVRVQKIVMTKAEVNAITKKGLIEMKDGAMILKAGVILPHNSDNKLIKNTLLSESFTESESPKLAPSTSQQSASSTVSTMKEEQVPKPTRYGGSNSDDDEEN